MLTITGPDMTPIVRDIDRATRRITVDVPVGNSRVFEVEAFPSRARSPLLLEALQPISFPLGHLLLSTCSPSNWQ